MRIQVTTLPPISIFFTNISLIAVIYLSLFLRLDGVAEPYLLGGDGGFVTPYTILMWLQRTVPHLSIVVSGILLLINSSVISRLSTRSMLYGVRSLTASPLIIIALGSVMTPENSLVVSLMSLMVSTSIYLSFDKIGIGNRSHGIFYGGLLSGLVLLIYPASAPMLLLVPFIIFLLRRTGREEIVMLFGLLFPSFVYLYSYWLCGYDLFAPLRQIYGECVELYSAGFRGVSSGELIFLSPTLLLLLTAVFALPTFASTSYQRYTQSKLKLMSLFVVAALLLLFIGCDVAQTVAISATAIALLANRTLVVLSNGLSALLYGLTLILFIISQLLFWSF